MKIFYGGHFDVYLCWLEIEETCQIFYYRFLNEKLAVRKVYNNPMPSYYFEEKEFSALPPFVQRVIEKDIPAEEDERAQYLVT